MGLGHIHSLVPMDVSIGLVPGEFGDQVGGVTLLLPWCLWGWFVSSGIHMNIKFPRRTLHYHKMLNFIHSPYPFFFLTLVADRCIGRPPLFKTLINLIVFFQLNKG